MAFDSRRTFIRISGLSKDADEKQRLEELLREVQSQTQKPSKLLRVDVASSANFPYLYNVAVVSFLGNREDLKVPVDKLLQSRRPELKADYDFYGWTLLYESPKGHEVVDIIAVTGLGAHAFASWQGKTIENWLRDYLPQDLKRSSIYCRVWTFGYASSLDDHDSMAGNYQFANKFRMELKNLVRRQEERPMRRIILIGHSLGCLVIKRALVDLLDKDQLFGAQVVDSIIALVFFGAPHKGMNIDAMDNYAWKQLRQRSQTMIKELGKDSVWLQELHDTFIARLRDAIRARIISLYETVKTKTMREDPLTHKWDRTGEADEAVTRSSATLQMGWQYETEIDVPRDHVQIARVTREEDHVYHHLFPELKDLIEKDMKASARAQSSTTPSVPPRGLIRDRLEQAEDWESTVNWQDTARNENRIQSSGNEEPGTQYQELQLNAESDGRQWKRSTLFRHMNGNDQVEVPRDLKWRLEWWYKHKRKVLCIRGTDQTPWLEPLARHVYSRLALSENTVIGFELVGRWQGPVHWVTNTNTDLFSPAVCSDFKGMKSTFEKSHSDPSYAVIHARQLWKWGSDLPTEDISEFLTFICTPNSLRVLFIIDSYASFLRKWISAESHVNVKNSNSSTLKLRHISFKRRRASAPQ